MPFDGAEAVANLGIIARLPSEAVWFRVLGQLSFRDLGRLVQTCRLLRGVVQEWHVWRDICAHAGEILHVLSAAFILDLHTPEIVHRTLCTGECSHCGVGSFGGFVNLLSFQRTCSSCARDEYDQWALDSETLCTVFALDDAQIRDLPTMRRIPSRGEEEDATTRVYSLSFARRKILLLQNVRRRALEVHGGQEGIEDAVAQRYGGGHRIELPDGPQPLAAHMLHCLITDGRRRAGFDRYGDVDLGGFDGKSNGHVSFPYLAEGEAYTGSPDPGYFCGPCLTYYQNSSSHGDGDDSDHWGRGDAYQDSRSGAAGMNEMEEWLRPLYAAMDQERSREAFAAHVRSPERCPYGVEGIFRVLALPDRAVPERSGKRKGPHGDSHGGSRGRRGNCADRRGRRNRDRGRSTKMPRRGYHEEEIHNSHAPGDRAEYDQPKGRGRGRGRRGRRESHWRDGLGSRGDGRRDGHGGGYGDDRGREDRGWPRLDYGEGQSYAPRC